MNKHIASHLTIALLAAVFGFAAPGYAATTDLATQPMAVTSNASIKPNILFLLDDSGSMAWDRLTPDTMAQTNSDTNLCYMNSVYNGVYYNPASTYVLPVDSTGTNYPNSTFTAAKSDGFDITSPAITNLSTGFSTGGNNNNSISGPGAFYYTYRPTTVATITVSGSSSTTVSSITVNGVQLMSASASGSSTNSTEANNIAGRITMNGFSATSSGSKVTITGPMSAATYSPLITKSGSDTFAVTTFVSDGTPTTPNTGTCYPDANYTRVNVTSASAEAQNFANWYSYYRTRILTMKSAAGRAFKNIDTKFRVGFTTINSIDGASPLVLPISDFDAAQRLAWYTDFYAITPNNSTPLRVALASAGKIYAHKLAGAADPMQYSCQQNFTIMTTDGMWNENATPTQLNGTTAVGNPDAAAPRPMYDGSSYTKTTKQNQQNTSTTYQNTTQLQALQTQSSTSSLQSSTSNLQSSAYALQSSTSNLQSSVYALQSSTANLQKSTMYLEKSTKSGGSWSAYIYTSGGTCSPGGSTRCRYTISTANNSAAWSAAAATWTTTTSCAENSNGSVGSSSTTGDGLACKYASYSTPTNAPSCTYQNQSTSGTWVGPAVTCSYATPTVTTVTSCSPVAKTTSTANGTAWTANAITCGYGSYSAAAPAGSCTYQNQSATSPYAGPAVTCSYAATPTVTTVTACSPVAKTTSTANGTVWDPTAHACGYSAYSTPANVSSCTSQGQSGGAPYAGPAVTCTYTAFNAWANTSSCTTVAQSATSPYTVGTATQCQNAWLGVNTCTAGTGGVSACQTVAASTPAASCSPVTASSGNNWTTTTCSTATTPWVGVASCTAQAANSSNGYVATNCHSPNPVTTTSNVSGCTPSSATAANSWTTTTCSGLTGGTANTLADVAYYYYQTDLRDSTLSNCTGALGTDVCFNNVPGAGADKNSQQHMTTFTLGLGVVGTLDPTNYMTGGSVDFENLKTGPNNWPSPVSNTNTTIDDLWHAAVNGRGQYFSAKSADDLVSGLSNALAGVSSRQGASAAASTSNMQPVPGDNFAYIAMFNTLSWDGDLTAKEIDPVTSKFVQDPVTGKDLIVWSAQANLDALVSAASDTRTIYTFDSSTSNKLKPFTWANLNATEQGYFSNMCSSPYQLSQCSTLIANDTANGTANATAASGANLVNFLRGQRGLEGVETDPSRIYRSRSHVLGDIVSAQPIYLRLPPFDYIDAGYADFKAAQTALNSGAGRTAMVYSGANDGMLHAFDAATGTEQWAYIPPMVMNNMYRLADQNYKDNHRYFVDGTPTIGEICPNAPASTCTGAQWKDILVGGLNGGGRGYYALDVTDPANPKALWNFTFADNNNLGYTFGNPVIAKRKDNCTTVSGVTTCTGGTWVVAITSGYNNVSPGDGKGHLFILNAMTGALLEDIVTAAGDTVTPNGLAKINAWVEYPNNNTAERFYGGDLLGNVWRFDIDNQVPPAGKEALLLAQLGMTNGATVQPITTEPGLAVVVDGGVTYNGVFVATGRYLGISDLANTDQQSIYGLKDNLTATGLGLVRTPGTLVQQTVTTYTGTDGNSYRRGTNNLVDWASKSGWYVDLNPGGDSPGERVNVDMNLQQKTLSVTGNVPDTNACNIGGYPWLYYFDFKSGYLPDGGGIKDTSNSLIAGTTQIQDVTGKTHTIITHTDGSVTIQNDIIPPPPPSFPRRGSWRELTN